MPGILERIIPRPRDKQHEARRHATAYKVLSVLALIALVLQTGLVLVSLFAPALPYRIADTGSEPLDSPEFLRVLAAVTGGWYSEGNRVQVFTNGEQFYEAELSAIRGARHFIHIECYILHSGRVADEVLAALEERARAGVEVRLVMDAIGSAAFPDSRFAALRQAGGHAAWYHPVRWYTWPRVNNRTHRELIVVDGLVGFAGGAGFADQWRYGQKDDPRWRDTMVRFEGGAATGIQSTFSENWLESSGEVLMAPRYYPRPAPTAGTKTLSVTSSPTTGRSSEARVLLQTLIAKATRSIHITNPYFLPDGNLRKELVRAVRERGVEVAVIAPGTKSDHLLTRRSSRALYGDLLDGGARIFEYQPSMIHAKITLIDGLWAVIGSTNFDSRSFGLNDEINVAVPDREVARRLEDDFQNDLKQSRRVSYQQWKNRPALERVQEWIGWVLEKQQ